jgi:hypothetical protein
MGGANSASRMGGLKKEAVDEEDIDDRDKER